MLGAPPAACRAGPSSAPFAAVRCRQPPACPPARPPPAARPPQYVATVHQGFVEGEGGLVYDTAGRAFHLPHHFYTRTGALPPLPTHTPEQVRALPLWAGWQGLRGCC